LTLPFLVDPVRIRDLLLRSSAAALAALLAAGCATFDKPLPAEPKLAVASLGATDTAVAWPRDDWWQRYGDPQLDQLITEGLAGNPTLAAARARSRVRKPPPASLAPPSFRRSAATVRRRIRNIRTITSFRHRWGEAGKPMCAPRSISVSNSISGTRTAQR
jgi:hypothetical protein